MRYIFIFFALTLFSCLPKDEVVFRSIENVELVPGKGADPILKADAIFYNPNGTRMKLKEIQMDLFIDGKKCATVNQQLKYIIKPKADFTVPLEVQLLLKEIRLMDALLSLIGGKRYELQYLGHVKVSTKGISFRIPVNYKRAVKL